MSRIPLAARALPCVVLLAAALAASPALRAQEPIDRAMIAKLRADEQQRSRVVDLFRTITDRFGGRLTGSPAHHAAAAWARDRFAEFGLTDAHLEPFAFGRGWTLEHLTLELVAPRYQPLTGYAEAWSPGTRAPLSGPVVYVGDKSLEQIEAMGEQLKGAIVFPYQPQTGFIDGDRPQPTTAAEPIRIGNPAGVPLQSAAPMRQVLPLLQRLGAGVVIKPSPGRDGTVFVLGSATTTDDAVPSIVLAAEQYNTIARLVASGTPATLHVDLGVRYNDNPNGAESVIAEIPGTDPALRDQVVMLGAHLDSWHTSSGATDNGDGAAALLEAARLLTATGARPRRTIRFALWGGEEQGLLGSHAYVARHFGDAASRARLALYLNDDPGTGTTYGFFMQDNAAAKAIFDAWLEPLRDLGVRKNILAGIGNTDHVSFDDVGLPAFNAVKDYSFYDSRTRHGNADYGDRVTDDSLRETAIVMAVFAWQAAQRDQPIPRKPETPKK